MGTSGVEYWSIICNKHLYFRGCESETDTEEFEKVCQSPLETNFDKDIQAKPGTQDASTLTEVGEKSAVPPKKPPRTFNKSHAPHSDNASISFISQRTLSISGSNSNTESFTNIKNPSLESIDELSSLKNFSSNTESCFNSHHQQMQNIPSNHLLRSKSLSPHTPQSPKDALIEQPSPISPSHGHQTEFVTDEFYIDESLPSSLSIENGQQSQGEFVKQLDTANNVVALLQVFNMWPLNTFVCFFAFFTRNFLLVYLQTFASIGKLLIVTKFVYMIVIFFTAVEVLI